MTSIERLALSRATCWVPTGVRPVPGQVLGDHIIEAELVRSDQPQEQHGGERLGNRAGVELGLGVIGGTPGAVCWPPPPREYNLAAMDGENRSIEVAPLVVGLHDTFELP